MLNPNIGDAMLSLNEYKRYSRHLILENIGREGQERVKAAKVICIGAGGLTSPILMYLSAAGIGFIGIVDNDEVEISNLQRQIIYDISNIGQSKITSAKSRLIALNPYCNVEIYYTKLSEINAYDIISKYDIIIDGSDNFSTRYILSDICSLLFKPLVYGAIFQFTGQISVLNYQGGPSYYALCPYQPPANLIPSCSEGGILGPLSGVIGSLQAVEVLKIILGIGQVLSGKILVYDALRIKFSYIDMGSASYMTPANILSSTTLFNCNTTKTTGNDKLKKKLLLSKNNNILIDVRMSYEYNIYHHSNAINIPLSKLEKLKNLIFLLKKSKSNKNLIIYCQSKSRSAVANKILLKYQIASIILKLD
uniref:Probable molybdopterin-synthase adenylyltransferase n=1 Tax=Boldia erythrosiphon TaxID=74908 RepID=A0A1Y9TLU4_9RHOD|nr:molybdopterin biosynthesis protein [Boldia erythrosiphon]ARO90580.1 molybdopterin biosynthesis protein [Boldia erythrosiphon]